MDNILKNPGLSKYLNGNLRARINDDKYINDVRRVLKEYWFKKSAFYSIINSKQKIKVFNKN